MHAPKSNFKEQAQAAFASISAVPGIAKPDPIIIANNVRRQFGGLTAVNVEHVEIQRGSITALIGPNGAGKTTFFNLLTGFDTVNEGNWTLNGEQISGTPPHKVARKGMVRTFQLTKALFRLSVLDNMRLAARHQRGESFIRGLFPAIWKKQEVEITAQAE